MSTLFICIISRCEFFSFLTTVIHCTKCCFAEALQVVFKSEQCYGHILTNLAALSKIEFSYQHGILPDLVISSVRRCAGETARMMLDIHWTNEFHHALKPVEFSRNTQCWQCWHFVLLKFDKRLDTVISYINLIQSSMTNIKFSLKLIQQFMCIESLQ